MKKKYGKNEASGLGTKNTVIMIVSILSVGLFIGMAIEPVMAGNISNQITESSVEECLPCQVKEKPPECKTCLDAVNHIINITIDHVKTFYPWDNVTKFPGWALELGLFIFDGIILGIKSSGFKFEMNYEELNITIMNWIEKFLDPNQYHTITRVLFCLGAIVVGIGDYLLSQCIEKNKQYIPSPKNVVSEFHNLIMVFLLIGQNI